MHPFRLDFAAPPHDLAASLLATAPAFRLDPPAAGWIICHVERAGFLPIRLSDVFPPLADLWLWSMAVAWELLPVTVRIAEEGTEVLFAAEALPGERLRLSLTRRMDASSFEPGRVIDAIVWTEARHAFLARWGAMWSAYCQDEGLPWSEWKRFENLALPEPMRDMPWGALANVPALEPPPWAREQRIAWFYLVIAYHLRSRGHGCEYLDDPAFWTLRELAFARLSIRAAQAAWGQLREGTPPPAEALRLIDDAQDLALDDTGASAQDEQALRLLLNHAYFDVMQATFGYITEIVGACLPHLPIAPGSFIADECGRRARILRVRDREWLLYWEDGRIGTEDAFYAGHQPVWRWPVAHGPDFDPGALDAIERREWRFHELGVSPVGIVCPVCGYPCMDDDTAEVQSCEFCDFALWTILSGDCPPMDAAVDDKAQRPTLRQLRANFLLWGHVGPSDEPIPPHSSRSITAQPAYRRLVSEAMAEWDAWGNAEKFSVSCLGQDAPTRTTTQVVDSRRPPRIHFAVSRAEQIHGWICSAFPWLEHPDPDHTPEEVWRRWNRWKDEQRQTGGHDNA